MLKLKKVFSVMLMAAVLGSSAGAVHNVKTVQAAYYTWTYPADTLGYVSHADGLKIRKEPSVSSTPIKSLPYGTILIIKTGCATSDPNNTTWYYVKTKSTKSAYNGIAGYVSAKYVKFY